MCVKFLVSKMALVINWVQASRPRGSRKRLGFRNLGCLGTRFDMTFKLRKKKRVRDIHISKMRDKTKNQFSISFFFFTFVAFLSLDKWRPSPHVFI